MYKVIKLSKLKPDISRTVIFKSDDLDKCKNLVTEARLRGSKEWVYRIQQEVVTWKTIDFQGLTKPLNL